MGTVPDATVGSETVKVADEEIDGCDRCQLTEAGVVVVGELLHEFRGVAVGEHVLHVAKVVDELHLEPETVCNRKRIGHEVVHVLVTALRCDTLLLIGDIDLYVEMWTEVFFENEKTQKGALTVAGNI
jgi:hypothetical protein